MSRIAPDTVSRPNRLSARAILLQKIKAGTATPADNERVLIEEEQQLADFHEGRINHDSVQALAQSIASLANDLMRPRTRTGVVDLPHGAVKMTIEERRGERK